MSGRGRWKSCLSAPLMNQPPARRRDEERPPPQALQQEKAGHARTVRPRTVALPSAVMSSAAAHHPRGTDRTRQVGGVAQGEKDFLVEALRLSFEHLARQFDEDDQQNSYGDTAEEKTSSVRSRGVTRSSCFLQPARALALML